MRYDGGMRRLIGWPSGSELIDAGSCGLMLMATISSNLDCRTADCMLTRLTARQLLMRLIAMRLLCA
jgi:hypothetical protein